MKTVCLFLAKFASLISWKLSCFDRVIFKGHLPFSYAAKFEAFVDYVLKMRRADFMQVTAPAWSEQLVEHAKAFAAKCGRLYEYYRVQLRFLQEKTAFLQGKHVVFEVFAAKTGH